MTRKVTPLKDIFSLMRMIKIFKKENSYSRRFAFDGKLRIKKKIIIVSGMVDL